MCLHFSPLVPVFLNLHRGEEHVSGYIFIAKDPSYGKIPGKCRDCVIISCVVLPANPNMMGMVEVKKTGLVGLCTAEAFILSKLRTEEL